MSVTVKAEALSEDRLAYMGAHRALNVLDDIIADERFTNARVVHVNVTRPTLDRLGNEGEVAFYSFDIPMELARKANFENLDGAMLLALSENGQPADPVSARYLYMYCAEPDYASASGSFCDFAS